MESAWDYVMRRKPIFLGYFVLFLVSCIASCQLLQNIIPSTTTSEPGLVQQDPSSDSVQSRPELYDRVLSPQDVARLGLADDASHEVSLSEPTISTPIISDPTSNPDTHPGFVHVEVANPTDTQTPDSTPTPDNTPSLSGDPTHDDAPSLDDLIAENPSDAARPDNPSASQPSADVPLTGGSVSIFRTVLAVLLAVSALTFAGYGLYQAYEYFRPLLKD